MRVERWQVLVETQEGHHIVEGSISSHVGTSAQEFKAELEGQIEPNLDYFIFEGPLPPQYKGDNKIFYVLAADAGKFSYKGGAIACSLLGPNPLRAGEFKEHPEFKFMDMIDQPLITQFHGEIAIETEFDQKFLSGPLTIFKGIPAEQVIADIEARSKSNLDYFVFEGHIVDRDRPGATPEVVTCVIETEANKFDDDGTPTTYTLLMSDDIGTLYEIIDLENFKLAGKVDRRWEHRAGEIKAEVIRPKGIGLTGHEKKLTEAVKERLMGRLEGITGRRDDKSINMSDIERGLSEVGAELDELLWGVDGYGFTLIDDPEGKEKVLSITVKVVSAASSISLENLPEGVRREATQWLDAEMRKTFYEHPLIASRGRGDLDGDFKFELRLADDKGIVSWRYPSNMPQFRDNFVDHLNGFAASKPVGVVPSPKPGEAMPIPAHVKSGFCAWLAKRLSEEEGFYSEIKAVRAGTTSSTIVFRHAHYPQYFIRPEKADEHRRKYGIDLGDEMKTLKEGTARWNARRVEEFRKGIEKKYKDAGLNLKLGEARISETETEIILDTDVPLIEPGQIIFEGDVDLPGIGGKEALSKILGTEPMSLAELTEKLLAVEDHYHNAGYLIGGENPGRKNGLQLKPRQKADGTISVKIKVVRMGQVKVAGEIPDGSKDALAGALLLAQGKPLPIDELDKRSQTAMTKLLLAAERENGYIIRRDGTMDIVIHAEKPNDQFAAGMGTNGETFDVRGGMKFLHPGWLPGTSEAAFSVMAGINGSPHFPSDDKWHRRFLNLEASAKTLPFNERGLYVSGNLGYYRSPYLYWEKSGDLEETGILNSLRGAVTLHIPLGSEGIASPFELQTTLRNTTIHRERYFQDGREDGGWTVYTGEGIALRMIFNRILASRDFINILVSTGTDHNLSDGMGDSTVGVSATHSLPVGGNFILHTKASAKKRLPLYGGDLPPERMLGPLDVEQLDFSRSFSQGYASTYYLHGGLLLEYRANPHFSIIPGVTVSNDPLGGARLGAGVAFCIADLGMCIYAGSDHEGQSTWGIASYSVY